MGERGEINSVVDFSLRWRRVQMKFPPPPALRPQDPTLLEVYLAVTMIQLGLP